MSMMSKQRFLVIAFPDDIEEEELAEYACHLQDAIDFGELGQGKVIAPIPGRLHDECAEQCAEHLKEIF